MNRLILLLITVFWFVPLHALDVENTFESQVEKLIDDSNSQLMEAIDKLAQIDDERVLPTLKYLLEAKLYYVGSSKQLVVVKEDTATPIISNLLTGELITQLTITQLEKVRINNKVRRTLNANISVLELKNPNQKQRLAAAKNLASNPDAEMRSILVDAIEKETSLDVLEYLKLALALSDIYSDDQSLRMEAAKIMADSVQPEAVAILTALTEKSADGKFIEQNTKLAQFSEKSMSSINSKIAVFKTFENLLYGLSLGSVLLLAAIGLAITFGVMGVINMAHGEMIMLGAYTTYAIQVLFPDFIDYSLLIALPAAFLVSGAMGVLIERLVIRHLYGRPLDTLLATFGISLILQQMVRTYNSNNVSVISPEWISGFWQINGAISITYNRIYIFVFGLVVLVSLALLMKKTLVGLQMRAVTQNRAMANSMGIRSTWVDAMTFGLGSGIAGIAGVALSQITSVGPNLGQTFIVDSFMVVVFGGVGNILGTFLGALSLGIANKFMEPYTGAVIGKIVMLIFIILFIQWRPRGLFALKGRFVED